MTLFERGALAAAASGRNICLWLPPEDPATQLMGRRSIEAYLALADDTPSPFRLDRAPIGYLLLAVDPHDVERGDETAQAIASAGVEVRRLDADAIQDREPAFAPDLAAAWWIDDGHRLDPGALTVALATRAATHGARIHHHTAVHALIERAGRLAGVVTDDGPAEADHVVLAAGPWTPVLCEPLSLAPPITGAVGWVVRVGPAPGGPTTVMESVGWRHHADSGPGWPTAREVARAGLGGFQSAPALHPHDDGSLTIGAMRQPWLTPEPSDPGVVRALLADAIRVAPAIADSKVRSSRWCVRPTTLDERPLIGPLRDGLWIASGHGSEGVILGTGSAKLLGSMLVGEDPPFDPTPFSPTRF